MKMTSLIWQFQLNDLKKAALLNTYIHHICLQTFINCP